MRKQPDRVDFECFRIARAAIRKCLMSGDIVINYGDFI